jgi:antitoxin HicB
MARAFTAASGIYPKLELGATISKTRWPKPLTAWPKLVLYLAMHESGMRNTELAKRLGVSETVVRRMLDPKHSTKPERIQAALAALGKRIVVGFEDAA